jgi:hypothetical protein
MPKVLLSDHAEDIGGVIVEPGEKIPTKDVDDDVVERLEAEGKIGEPGGDQPAAAEKKGK